MKVLLVTQYFWPESFRINELIDSMQIEGAEITVITGQPNYPEGNIFKGYSAFSIKRESHNGYSIIRLPMFPRGHSGAFRLVANYMSFTIAACFLAPWLLRGKKFDSIFVYGLSPILTAIPAIILKKIKKTTPLITWVGDLWPESLVSTGFVKNRYLLRILEKLVSYIYRNSDLVLIQSRPFREPIKKLSPLSKIEYFPNPGETFFSNNESLAPVYALKEGFNVVFAGNLGRVQSIKMIFEAAVILQNESDINLYLFGSGSMSEWLRKEIDDKKLERLILAGRFLPKKMPGIFAQADVLLVSLVKDETMSFTVPAKVQSYMASGKPIIAALDGEGAKLIEEAGAGIYSPAEDAQALANTILRLRNMPRAELDKMGLAGRTYYEENFDSRVLSRQLIKRMRELRSKTKK